MARPLRIQYPGAVYHVMARGNHGQGIFQDDRDRQCFLETLGEACEKTGWRIHACVLMDNHYHLLVETPEGNLAEGMKWVQGAYTQRYNRRHKLVWSFVSGALQGGDRGRAGWNLFSGGQHLHSFEPGAGRIDPHWTGAVEAIPLEQLSVVFEPGWQTSGLVER